jgi:hypothetical protein
MRVAPIIGLCFTLAGASCSGSEPGMGGPVLGYLHRFAKTRFEVGTIIEEKDEFGDHKVVGEKGVFATNLVTHATTAIPNSSVPDPSGNVFPGNAEAQGKAVVDYFTGAGLPLSQISSVTADQSGASDAKDGNPLQNSTVVAWYSVLHRAYHRVPIEGSVAWTMLGKSGNSLIEQVYWPEIPERVWDRTREFSAMLATPERKAQFMARFPADASQGELVVRHTAWHWSGQFEAAPCYRFTLRGLAICLDEGGRPLRLADEAAMVAPSTVGPLP